MASAAAGGHCSFSCAQVQAEQPNSAISVHLAVLQQHPQGSTATSTMRADVLQSTERCRGLSPAHRYLYLFMCALKDLPRSESHRYSMKLGSLEWIKVVPQGAREQHGILPGAEEEKGGQDVRSMSMSNKASRCRFNKHLSPAKPSADEALSPLALCRAPAAPGPGSCGEWPQQGALSSGLCCLVVLLCWDVSWWLKQKGPRNRLRGIWDFGRLFWRAYVGPF